MGPASLAAQSVVFCLHLGLIQTCGRIRWIKNQVWVHSYVHPVSPVSLWALIWGKPSRADLQVYERKKLFTLQKSAALYERMHIRLPFRVSALRLHVKCHPPCRLCGCIPWPKQGYMHITLTFLMCHNLERKESFLERPSIHKPLWGTQNVSHLCGEEAKGKRQGFSYSWCHHPCLMALGNLKWKGERKTKPEAGGDNAAVPVSGLIRASQGPAPLLLCCGWREPGSSSPCRAGPWGWGGTLVGRGISQWAGPSAAGSAESPSHPLSVSWWLQAWAWGQARTPRFLLDCSCCL